jgi:glycerol-3-phosphate dehydrogenase (NAD(P)+)
MKAAVVGAGAWGTTLANLLAHAGHEVRLWAREPEVVDAINRTHVNEWFLPSCRLHPSLRADGEIAAAVRGAELVVSAPPSHAVRTVGAAVADALTTRPIVVSVSKGLETDSLATMSAVLEETLPGCPVVTLSGPSFALEVYQGQPTAIVAACADPAAAEHVQQVLATPAFRVYTSTDVIGAELGGALKNVIAIAAGMLEGLGLGHNPLAALLTRGLAETARLGEALGAEAATFAGLAGMGDLILTATGPLSRNRSLGVEVGRGSSLAQVLATRRSVAEGVQTARAAVALGRRAGIELPIASEVSQILFEDKAPRRAIADLMERELKAEQWR